MVNSTFRYVLNRLLVLNDDEIERLNVEDALQVVKAIVLDDEDKELIIRLLQNIHESQSLKHHGILGMKWGVRRYQNKDGTLTSAGEQRRKDSIAKDSIFGTAKEFKIKTRTGEIIVAKPVAPLTTAQKILDVIFETSKNELGRRGDANYTLNSAQGKKIGELSLLSKNADTTYWDWIQIEKDQRGKGYATDVIQYLFTQAKESGYSKVQINALEKPRPLYERLGFTYTDTKNMNVIERFNSFEFGAKLMEFDLKSIKHSAELTHHGILGMKWGVRRDRGADGTVGGKSKAKSTDDRIKEKRRTDVKNRRQLSDDQLIKKIARLEREKKLRELTDVEINAGKKATSDIMKSVGSKVATTVITGVALYGIKAILTGNVDIQDMAGYLTPKPGRK